MDSGRMIKLMAMVSMSLLMEVGMKGIGKMISAMGKGNKLGKMELHLKDFINSMKRMVMVSFFIAMGIHMSVNSAKVGEKGRA